MDKERLTREEQNKLLASARPLTTRLAMLNRIQSVKPLTPKEAIAQEDAPKQPRS